MAQPGQSLWEASRLVSKLTHQALAGNIGGVLRTIREGCNPNIIFNETTVLHIAVELNNIAMVLGLILTAKNLDLNIKNPWGDTPLMVACQQTVNLKIIAVLLKYGADPNILLATHHCP